MNESEIARRKVFVVEIPTEVWVELRTEITMLMLRAVWSLSISDLKMPYGYLTEL